MALFSDRAWYSDNARGFPNRAPTAVGVLFVRANVVASVHIGHRDGLDPQLLFDLAARLSQKIDAAAAGHPEPPPLLPPSAEEMHLDLEGAWAAYQSAKLLPGKNDTRLALQQGKALARALPARQVAPKEFMVPLAQLAGILGASEKAKVGPDQASVRLAGKTMTFTKGRAQAKYGERTLPLARPAEFNRGQVLVPLSVVETALGRKIAWEKKGPVMIARLP